MPSKLTLIGLTGTNAAGKGEIGSYLGRHGYVYRSLSDVLRDEARDRGLEASRENLIALGRELRETEGAGTLAKRTVSSLPAGRYVIDSVRNPSEIDVLEKAGSFLLLAVDAPIDVRFDRAQKRGRNENAATLGQFREMENRERSTETHAQQIDACLKRAHRVLDNRGTLDDLHKQVTLTLEEFGFPLN